MIDRLNTLVRLTDILMDVEKDGGHAMGCKYVKSWPFKGDCELGWGLPFMNAAAWNGEDPYNRKHENL